MDNPYSAEILLGWFIGAYRPFTEMSCLGYTHSKRVPKQTIDIPMSPSSNC